MSSSNTCHKPRAIPKGRAAWLLAAAWLAVPAWAVDPNRAMSQYIRDHWGLEKGFPRGPVYAIAQTADGYLWIGAEAGLVRFDGLHFKLMRDLADSYRVTSVLGLLTDNEDNLWVRLPGPSLLRFRNGRFEDLMSSLAMPYSNITGMSRSASGGILISRLEEGSVSYSKGTFEVIAAATPPARSPVLSLTQTQDGDIWMGTRDAGLFRLHGDRVSPPLKGLPDTKINCLLPEPGRGLWIGTDSGLALWDGKEVTSGGLTASLNRFQALALARDRDGNLWVGTDTRGLLRVNARGAAFLDESAGAPREAVTALFEDREGNLWIGSASGLERLRDSAFVTYSLPEGLPSDGSRPLFADRENRTWVAPAEGGLWWLKDGRTGKVTEGGLDRDIIYSIAGRGGELWLGRQRGGVTRLFRAGAGYSAEHYTKARGLAQNSVYAVHQSRDGTVWAGTLSAGITRIRGGKLDTFTTADGLASNSVWAILETRDGTVWVGTPSGASAFSGGRWKTYTPADGLPVNGVNCFLEDSGGVLWVGTPAGLARRQGARFETPAGAPASLREPVLGIAEDRLGSLWIATANRVLRIKRDALLRGAGADKEAREYGIADGLRGVEGVKRHQSVVTDPLGRIWFSMNRGISVVDPARLTGASAPAIAHVQAISADGSPVDLRWNVRVPAGSRRITFDYAGLGLSIPERIRFRYRLEGFDQGWSDPAAAREAVYTNLSPGPYRFLVMASNPDGIWNGAEAAIAFEIEPLFWQTWWFRISMLAGGALAAAILYRRRMDRMVAQLNVRFEERLAERTRIAQELHDTLLQGFLSASMQLHVAADGLPEDSAARPPLERVLGLMGKVIDEGRNVVRGLRSQRTESLELEDAFSKIQREMGIHDDVEFRVIVEGKPLPLHPVLRDEVYRIGREALVNAFRHSRARRIEVDIEYGPSEFRLLVRDDGCGVDPAVLRSGRDGHWGLSGMRERAERIGARLKLSSRASAGTEVELSVPGRLAFEGRPSNGLWKRLSGIAGWNGSARPGVSAGREPGAPAQPNGCREEENGGGR